MSFINETCWFFGINACLFFLGQGCTPSAEDMEAKRLVQARAQSQASESQMKRPERVLETPVPITDVPMSLMMEYDNLSPLMQSYFGDDKSTAQLIENLKRDREPLEAPVMVRIKWIPMDLNRGKGVISVVYNKPIESLEQLQPVATALLKYRNYVGGAFDMRLLSFEMFIAGTGVAECGFSLLNKSGLAYGVVSPCLTIDEEKICMNEDGAMSANMKAALQRCLGC